MTYHQRIQLCSTSPKINWKNFHHQTQHFVWQAHSWFNYGWIHAQVSIKYGNNFREQNYTKLLQGQLVELQGFRDHLIFIFITCLRRFVVRHIWTGLIITESKGTWGWDLLIQFLPSRSHKVHHSVMHQSEIHNLNWVESWIKLFWIMLQTWHVLKKQALYSTMANKGGKFLEKLWCSISGEV